jgi:hypothetical protein
MKLDGLHVFSFAVGVLAGYLILPKILKNKG